MKLFVLNQYYISLIGLLFLFSSCSKEEESVTPTAPSSDLEDVNLSFTESSSTEIATVPEAMASSSDAYAQQAVGHVELVNNIGSYFNYFQPPTGASKSSQPITIANGRIEAQKKEYLTYTWTDQETTIAYQLSEESDKYVWEIFLKQGDGDYQRFIYAEESKVGRIGKMDIYNYLAGQANDLLVKYTWEEKDDKSFILTGIIPSGDLTYVITVNPDASGSAMYSFSEGKYEIQWDALGNGNWSLYSEGSVVSSGDWSV